MGKGGRGAGKSTGGDCPKAVSSRYRAKLDAARAFSCDVCSASFVREDSLRSHRKQHRDTQLQLAAPVPAVHPLPAQLEVPVSSDALAPYSSAQLKIIVSPAAAETQNKTNMVLLSPENQDVVVNSMIQQVNLLAPVQPLGPSQTADAALVPQTVLLTQLSTEDANNPLHQALLQTAITAQDAGGGSQTFITTCSELEGLNALIQEGGTEVTVVTEGNTAMVTATSAADMAGGAAGGPAHGDREGRGQCLTM